jgi:surfeit locus 1 family protein
VTELPAGAPRSLRALLAVGGLCALGILLLIGLGVWQVERLGWKLALIQRVDQRVHAAAVAPPGPADWPGITQQADEYRRVAASGHYLNADETLVEAVTSKGGGFWVMTPFTTDAGFTVLVNRGFVPSDRRAASSREAGESEGPTTVTGLMRMSEPGGGFLRANDPAGGRWYSRDVSAIAAAHGLTNIAPYFIDADATPNPGGLPIGGLTVLDFPNNHLIYALTWFVLAAMLAGATGYGAREEWRRRAQAGEPSMAAPR